MAVAPVVLAPEAGPLVISLLALAGFLVAAGLIYVLHQFTRATIGGIAGLIHRIPGVRAVLSSPINAVYHWMDHEFGVAQAALDKQVARWFHALAKTIIWIGDEIAAHANLLWTLSTIILGPALTELIRQAVHAVAHEVHALRAQLHHLAATITGPLIGRVASLEHWAHGRVHYLTARLDHVIAWDLPHLRARTRALENEYDALWKKVRGLDKLFGTAVFAGAVAVALSRLELGWLRCNSLRRLGHRIGCGGFGLLESFFGDAVEAFIVSDLCDFIAAASVAVGEIEPLLIAFVDVEDVLIGCHGASKPLTWTLPAPRVPPVPPALALAA